MIGKWLNRNRVEILNSSVNQKTCSGWLKQLFRFFCICRYIRLYFMLYNGNVGPI